LVGGETATNGLNITVRVSIWFVEDGVEREETASSVKEHLGEREREERERERERAYCKLSGSKEKLLIT
jgi:hypothetical protein